MRVRTRWVSRALGAVCALSAAAALADDERADNSATPDSLVANAIENLRANRSLEAVREFLGSSSLMAGRTTEMQMLARQVDGTLALYGPIASCEEVAREDIGTLVARRTYFCQHTRMVTRWLFVVAKTREGWIGANFTFDDKIHEGPDMRPVYPAQQVLPPAAAGQRVSLAETGRALGQ